MSSRLVPFYGTDDFSSAAINASKWTSFTAGGAAIAQSDGRLVITFPNSSTSSTDGDIVSTAAETFKGKCAILQIIEVPNRDTTANGEFRIYTDSNNWFRWVFEGGKLYAQRRKGGIQSTLFTLPDSIDDYTDVNQYRYLSIRERAGRIRWEYSADGKNWNLVPVTYQHLMDVSAMKVLIAGTCYENVTAAGRFVVDNFNIEPEPVSKRYEYHVSRGGIFLGILQNVVSPFTYNQNINTASAALQLSVQQNVETSHELVEPIETDSGLPLETDGGEIITTDRAPDAVGNNNPNALIRNNNDVKVYEYSTYHPNGVIVFAGYISRWAAKFGGPGNIEATVLSYGTELDNYLIEGASVSDQSQLSQDNAFPLQEPVSGTPDFWRAGQTYQIGAGVTNQSAIKVKLYAYITEVVTVKMWNTEAEFYSGAAPLGVASQSVAGQGALPGGGTTIDYTFTFPSQVSVNPGQSVFFTVQCTNTIANVFVYFKDTTNPYANGEMLTSIYSGGSGGGSWAPNGIGQDMYFETFTTSGATNTPFTSEDPADILTEIVDSYISRGGLITYTDSSIISTGLAYSYTFKVNTILEGIKKCLDLAPSNYYFYVDPATSIIYFMPVSETADHTLTLGREINSLTLEATIETLKNIVYFSGGDTGSGENLYQKVVDSDSLQRNRVGIAKISDNRVTLPETATALAQNYLDSNSEETYQTKVTVVDGLADLQKYKPGQTIGFRGFGTFVDNLTLQIVAVQPADGINTLSLGVLPRRANAKVEDINRDLTNLQTINNPSVPS